MKRRYKFKNIEEGKITVDSHDELDLWEPEQIPHTLIRLAEGQILEDFMLEEEIEFQGIDKCKIVELPDKQEIEICVDRETVRVLEMPMRIAYEQEECDRSLPKMYRAEESVLKDEITLETPEINTVEISKLPREVKLEMPIEQSKSKLVQDMTLVSDKPTPFHAEHEILLPNGTINLSKTEGEIPVPNRNILGKSILKLHTRQRKVLGSKLVRRVNPTRLVKRKFPSMCRPPPRPPDRQNSLNDKASKRVLPNIDKKGDPLPNLLISIMPMKKEIITGPLQKFPQKVCDIARVPWTR